MQYHLNGFSIGDPSISNPEVSKLDNTEIIDVLIVGCGPAGLTLAAQLSAFPEIKVRIVDKKSGPLEIGRADGIACRSIEMFEAFGFAEKVLKEAYWVNEVAFWRPNEAGGGLHRANRIQDVEDDLSEMPHVILSQARVHDFYLKLMRNSVNRLEPDYDYELIDVSKSDDPNGLITATFRRPNSKVEAIRTRYVVGCDGARSMVRKSMGQALQGESARQLWGVMDVLAVTDFPDIRLKAAVQSLEHGSVLIIPREGGYLVRMYIELDALRGDERAIDRAVTSDTLIAKARDILAPYTLDVKEVAWWSAYEIGQRICDAFDDVPDADRARLNPRIFIAGDACHTHSPKAGQGMNVSMADTFNLGWKLAAVLRGQAIPSLLHTYSEERYAKAKELIDFDRDMARLFSTKPKNAFEAKQFQSYFKKHGRYTAGVETRYSSSMICSSNNHEHLASGLRAGMRFHSAPVIRTGDGKPMHLSHTIKADGRWRLFAFGDDEDVGQPSANIASLCKYLCDDLSSPIMKYTPAAADIDSVIDLRAVFQCSHQDMNPEQLPKLLLPTKGCYGLIDYEKVFCPDFRFGSNIFDLRGLNRKSGVLLVVRPDQFIARVQPLDDYTGLAQFFDRFMIEEELLEK